MRWYRRDREAVLAATTACGPLDELVAVHEELGILATPGGAEVERERAGIADALLALTLATLRS